MPTNKILILF